MLLKLNSCYSLKKWCNCFYNWNSEILYHIKILLCPTKVNSNTIALNVPTSWYCTLDLPATWMSFSCVGWFDNFPQNSKNFKYRQAKGVQYQTIPQWGEKQISVCLLFSSVRPNTRLDPYYCRRLYSLLKKKTSVSIYPSLIEECFHSLTATLLSLPC